jgi:hypothetical protein
MFGLRDRPPQAIEAMSTGIDYQFGAGDRSAE